MEHRIKIIFILILSIFLVYGIRHFVSAGPKEYEDISVSDFYGRFKDNPGIFLLDVRTPEEYRDVHVRGTSRLIPIEELERRIDEMKGLEEKEIYVICRSGRRSVTASKLLTGHGFKKVFNITGGVMEYKKMNYPVEQGGPIP
ncbi:MAG: rhodanese-like domain-containing protein [Nitrospirae bacterium]|nr:rhodanese-like domain-containing protein [Nitrospirota bacterium]